MADERLCARLCYRTVVASWFRLGWVQASGHYVEIDGGPRDLRPLQFED